MKKHLRFFGLPIFALLCVVACEKNNDLDEDVKDPQGSSAIKGEFVGNSGCKSNELRTSTRPEAAKFIYDEAKGEVTFTAVNRFFACESSHFNTTVRVDNEDIFIELSAQEYIVDERGDTLVTKCICPYDITCKLTGVEKKAYTVHVTGRGEQSYVMDLTQQSEGAFYMDPEE